MYRFFDFTTTLAKHGIQQADKPYLLYFLFEIFRDFFTVV